MNNEQLHIQMLIRIMETPVVGNTSNVWVGSGVVATAAPD